MALGAWALFLVGGPAAQALAGGWGWNSGWQVAAPDQAAPGQGYGPGYGWPR